MTKRFQIIWTIAAIIFFIIAFFLDITSFGHDKISWEDIDIIRILLIIVVVIASGLLLALFLFNKQNYKKRVLLTIPIAFIIFSFSDILKTTISNYGLDEDYNYFSAKRDIRKGKIQILETGLILPEPNIDWDKKQEAERKIEKQFGYKSINLGCTVTQGIGIYNSVMEDYLEKINGEDWRAKERHILDSIMNSNKPE